MQSHAVLEVPRIPVVPPAETFQPFHDVSTAMQPLPHHAQHLYSAEYSGGDPYIGSYGGIYGGSPHYGAPIQQPLLRHHHQGVVRVRWRAEKDGAKLHKVKAFLTDTEHVVIQRMFSKVLLSEAFKAPRF